MPSFSDSHIHFTIQSSIYSFKKSYFWTSILIIHVLIYTLRKLFFYFAHIFIRKIFFSECIYSFIDWCIQNFIGSSEKKFTWVTRLLKKVPFIKYSFTIIMGQEASNITIHQVFLFLSKIFQCLSNFYVLFSKLIKYISGIIVIIYIIKV